MEFLRSQFEEELNAEGDITIANQAFLPSNILQEMAPEAYDLTFNEWIQSRKTQLIEKADEILEQFDNKLRFEQLALAYRGGAMIPFIGAGMSRASGFPLWTSFLFQLCEESHVTTDTLEELIEEGKYEEAAQELYNDLGEALFNENIQVAFDRTRESVGPINYLSQLFQRSSVLTTNFDCLLERIYENDTNAGFDRVISGKSLNEVLRQITGGSRLLIKLHGDCRQVAERVLLKAEYDAAYTDEKSVENFFSRVIFGNALLFLGCSLSSDRTITTMKNIVSEIGSDALPRHYAFLGLRDGEDRIVRKKHLSEANIFPIWYEAGDDDEAIEALFLKLMDDE